MWLETSMHESVKAMWEAYLRSIGEDPVRTYKTYSAWHFCNNEQDANELAALVRQGRKRATASSQWSCEQEGQPLPKPGDLSLILDWEGQAQCVIRTTRVDILPFEEVSEEFAWTEGEGDRSLDYWRKGHWRFFSMELRTFGREPEPRMPIVCERFDIVFGGTA
jgi:uncharacterized protein YhfF